MHQQSILSQWEHDACLRALELEYQGFTEIFLQGSPSSEQLKQQKGGDRNRGRGTNFEFDKRSREHLLLFGASQSVDLYNWDDVSPLEVRGRIYWNDTASPCGSELLTRFKGCHGAETNFRGITWRAYAGRRRSMLADHQCLCSHCISWWIFLLLAFVCHLLRTTNDKT
ncbi:hypothetical protein R1flu_008840 [Riccia fluitans]|uniref:Uncharacterized protein n=1 Tax=Riccia fluitans TaxID=41844 RepID=A0ABD1Z176_9MARC